MTTNDIYDVTYYYVENVFFPNNLHLGNICAYDLNLGSLSWVLPINYPTDVCQTIKRCLLKLLLDISTKFDLKTHLIVLGFNETKPSDFRPWEELFAKKYPMKYFLKNRLDIAYTGGWDTFFNNCQFYEKETNSYYLQWWQTTLTPNNLDRPAYLLRRNHIDYGRGETIVFVSKMNDEDVSKNIFDNWIYKTAFPIETPDGYRGIDRDSYKNICDNKCFTLGVSEMIDSPSIAVTLTGDSDLLKEIYFRCTHCTCPTN